MKKILYVCSGGGHMTELLELVSAYPDCENVFVTGPGKKDSIADAARHFVRTYSLPLVKLRPLADTVLICKVLRILLRERPDYIISAGGEITVPFFYLGKLLLRARLIFIESAAQVYLPSITGRTVYPVTDLFLVQWKQLKEKHYPKARYAGGLL